MRFFPNEVILSWPTPNYVDPVTRGDAIFYVNSIFIAVVVIICILRLYTRFFIKHWLGADDAFITIALVGINPLEFNYTPVKPIPVL